MCSWVGSFSRHRRYGRKGFGESGCSYGYPAVECIRCRALYPFETPEVVAGHQTCDGIWVWPRLAAILSALPSGGRFARFARGPGPSAALAVRGEAGAGKSTLWKAGIEEAAAAGYRVLRSEPSASETDLPFAGLSDLLGDVLPLVVAQIPGPQQKRSKSRYCCGRGRRAADGARGRSSGAGRATRLPVRGPGAGRHR